MFKPPPLFCTVWSLMLLSPVTFLTWSSHSHLFTGFPFPSLCFHLRTFLVFPRVFSSRHIYSISIFLYFHSFHCSFMYFLSYSLVTSHSMTTLCILATSNWSSSFLSTSTISCHTILEVYTSSTTVLSPCFPWISHFLSRHWVTCLFQLIEDIA